MPIITIKNIEDAYKDKQATQEWNQANKATANKQSLFSCKILERMR